MRVSWNAPTPETATTTHFFYAHARLFKTDSAATDEVYRRDFYRIFMEDVAIVEAQQASLDRNAAAGRIDINVDAPGLAMRALLREHIAAESAAGDKRDELIQTERVEEIEQLIKEVRALQGRLQEPESR